MHHDTFKALVPKVQLNPSEVLIVQHKAHRLFMDNHIDIVNLPVDG